MLKRLFFVICLLSWGRYTYCLAQSQAGLYVWTEIQGSVPPVNPWFDCVRELQDKPYDKTKTQKCLESILSHPEIGKGSFSLDTEKNLLTFRFDAPTLVVTDLDLDVPAGELARFHELFNANEAVHGEALHVGKPYTTQRETQVWSGMDLFLRSQGRRTGVSRTLRFDYSKKTVQAAYRVWDAPRQEPQPLAPPFGQRCTVWNANFPCFDVGDDLTPVQYIRQQLKTKWLGCFSENDVRDDEELLKKMPFLKESKISVSGSGGSRNICLHFRSNPIPITKITVHGYGLLDGLTDDEIPPLAIHAGDTYSSSRTSQQAESLKHAFEKPDQQLKVFVDFGITPKGEATLDFSLLAYPDDVVDIDGKSYDVTRKWQGPYIPD
jgi:hypothetical protein